MLDSKLDLMQLTVEDHGQRMSSLEHETEDLSQRVIDHENTYSNLREENKRLKAKVTDLEGHSRVRMYVSSIPESIESK